MRKQKKRKKSILEATKQSSRARVVFYKVRIVDSLIYPEAIGASLYKDTELRENERKRGREKKRKREARPDARDTAEKDRDSRDVHVHECHLLRSRTRSEPYTAVSSCPKWPK